MEALRLRRSLPDTLAWPFILAGLLGMVEIGNAFKDSWPSMLAGAAFFVACLAAMLYLMEPSNPN